MQSTAQSPTDEDSNASPDSSDSSGIGRDSQMGFTNLNQGAALSADQITNILQQSPDLVLELKNQLADRMQQQGVQIDPNDISDQMLYNQIATNADLRANITTVLRARGYVSGNDLQSLGSGAAGQEGVGSQSLAQQAPLMDNGANGTGLDTSSGANEGATGIGGIGSSATTAESVPSNRNGLSQMTSPRRQEKPNTSTDVPKVLRQPAPYNLQSMRDLYAQIPEENAGLKRFGSEVFVNREISAAGRGVSARDTPLDLPLGPDYIVGAGDTLTIHLWGGITQSISRIVDRDGTIFLPEAGSVEIAGLPLGKAQVLIEAALKQQFRNAQVAVTVSRLRSVRVYVVGDVQRPGGYDISSLSTPLSALYTAGGPTAAGSLRTLLHYRGKQLVEEVDLYDFLLHGIRNGSASFESGDTLLVPPAGSQVAVFGAVKRPAIYELKTGETTLATVIDDAGGFTAAASLGHIRIERIDANQQRETVTLRAANQSSQADHDAVAAFGVKDGDRIRVEPILPYSQRAIYLAGHVVRPGRLAYTDGMRLSDVLRSYQDMLPEPAAHGEIVRLIPPDLHAETIDFNVPDVLIGNANINLQPFDTIRIFGRYQVDAPTVTVRGEVLRPGKYPMSQGMTAAQLVRMAGGFKRDALKDNADLTSYDVGNGNEVVEKLATVRIGAAVAGSESNADVLLKPGDILAIHQITNWENIGESVTINGEVRFPGSYGFQDGERLSSVLRRAGGLLSTAYPLGAVFVRIQVKELEQKSRDELVRQIETSSAAARLSPSLASSGGPGALQLIKDQQNQVLSDLKSHPPTGRMVIRISADIDSWANTPADIELRRGDVLTIPKRPGFVLVSGQVYNATALTFTPGKTAGWYLKRAGGTNTTADRKEIFVIRANGSVVGRHSGGWFEGDVLSTLLNPGDVIVVPQKVLGGSLFWKNLLATAQLAGSIAITAGVAASVL
jgi:protein involved in polysaccharide export with SLBB domain